MTRSPAPQGFDPAAPPPAPRRILIAEDEHLLARSLQADLEELGFEVVGVAGNGEQAVALARQHKPELVLLDVRMPVMDGLSAAEAIHAELGIPTIVISAYSDPPYVQAGARLGVFGYLLKPVSLDQLRVGITIAWARFLDQRRLAGEVRELNQKIEDRKIIERAKGLLMKNQALDEEQAMRSLQKQARDARRPMVDVARQILENAGVGDTTQRSKSEG